MTWQEIREQFPNQWVLVEALNSSSQNGYWTLEKMAVLNSFIDGEMALDDYEKIHDKQPLRDLAVLHTSRPQSKIAETHWLGIRSLV